MLFKKAGSVHKQWMDSTLNMMLDWEYLGLSHATLNFENTWLGAWTFVDRKCDNLAKERSYTYRTGSVLARLQWKSFPW